MVFSVSWKEMPFLCLPSTLEECKGPRDVTSACLFLWSFENVNDIGQLSLINIQPSTCCRYMHYYANLFDIKYANVILKSALSCLMQRRPNYVSLTYFDIVASSPSFREFSREKRSGITIGPFIYVPFDKTSLRIIENCFSLSRIL